MKELTSHPPCCWNTVGSKRAWLQHRTQQQNERRHFGWSAKYPADSSELPAAQSALWFCLKDPSPPKCDFSVHEQKHLLEFRGAFSLMPSIHFYMMQHIPNILAFALCCVKGTSMEMMYLNPKCCKNLNQLLPNPARTTPQAVQERVWEPGIQWSTSYLITI